MGKRRILEGNLQIIDCEYIKTNKDNMHGDWQDPESNAKHWEIQSWDVKDDAQLYAKLTKAREITKFLETGNNGGRFDYDVCISDHCWGGNSNTVQKYIHNAMGNAINIPKGFNLPGIYGKFYVGPTEKLRRSNTNP